MMRRRTGRLSPKTAVPLQAPSKFAQAIGLALSMDDLAEAAGAQLKTTAL